MVPPQPSRSTPSISYSPPPSAPAPPPLGSGGSGIDATDLGGVGDPLDRHEIGAEAQRDPVEIGLLAHLRERSPEDALELPVDLALLPEERLQVLHPLEVRHRHATGIGEDVWHDHDAPALEDEVGVGGGGAVGALDDDRRAQSTS